MIFVTGGTGFIGQALIRHLVQSGYPVRSLIRPSSSTPNLPRGIPMEVALCSLGDERGLRAALKDVEVVYHLAGSEHRGSRADLLQVDIRGSQNLVRACVDAGVRRLFFLSHLGADRASAYPVLKAKAITENFVRQSGIPYTILRSAVVYGPNDHFTTGLARLLSTLPGAFLLPGDGSTLLQPLWVEDLATCLEWALHNPDTENQVIPIGGSEAFPFKQIVQIILDQTGLRRTLVGFSPAYLRGLTVYFEHLFPAFPVSVFWLDYLSADRTCALDGVPRWFGLMPARFTQRLNFLGEKKWRQSILRLIWKKQV